jgi:hypothetical protein
MHVLLVIVRRGCCPYLRRVSLARIPRIPKEKMDSCWRRNDINSLFIRVLAILKERKITPSGMPFNLAGIPHLLRWG